jgi:outer membrane murein-binding lipoprotein Lpp
MYKMAQKDPPKWWLLLFAVIAYFLMVWLLSGCSPQKKMAGLMDNHPNLAAYECADRFPVIEGTDTIYVEPDSSLLANYEQHFAEYSLMVDSLLSVRCPDGRIEVIETLKEIPGRPVVKVVTKTVESTARLRVVQDSCDFVVHELELKMNGLKSQIVTSKAKQEKAEARLDLVKRQRNTYLWLFIVLLLWTFRKPLVKLIRKILIKI